MGATAIAKMQQAAGKRSQLLHTAGDKLTKQNVSGERDESDDSGGFEHGSGPVVGRTWLNCAVVTTVPVFGG